MPSVTQINHAFEDAHQRLREALDANDREDEMWARSEIESLYEEVERAKTTVPVYHRY